MKRTLRQGLAALAAAGLASSAWADYAQWVGCETYVGSTCQLGNWEYSSNWVRKGLPQQPATGGPALHGDVVRVAPDAYSTTSVNYVDTKSLIINGVPYTPIFESLSIQGVAVTHSGAFDSMRTLSLTIGDGGKYTFDSASGGVGLGGYAYDPKVDPVPTVAIIGSLNGSASFEHLGSGGVYIGGTGYPNNLVLGQDAGSSGTYVMGAAAGTLYLGFSNAAGKAGSTIVGEGGDGTFVQQGGSHVTGTLVLSQNAGDAMTGISAATGTYSLSGGTLEVRGSGNSLQVGLGGSGTFNQSGGSVTAQGVTLGVNSGSTGAYTMSGGTLASGTFVVGDGGNGDFNNLGASHTVTGDLIVGRQAGSTGSNAVSGSTVVSGNVIVAAQPGSSGTLNVISGGLHAANVNVNAGGTVNYTGGDITLDGSAGKLTNALGGQVNVYDGGSLTIDGFVDNAGTFKVTGPGTTVTYTRTFSITDNGKYESDPATNNFQSDLAVSGNGYLVGGLGDVFEIGGGFLNASTNASQWDTNLATLIFADAGDHRFGVAAGVGALAFGWGDIRAGAGVQLSFYDSVVANNGMALYVGILDLADGLNAILLDAGELLTIYFDRSKSENSYLLAALENPSGLPRGLTLVAYGAPTPSMPEAPTLPLLFLGFAGIAVVRRQRSIARGEIRGQITYSGSVPGLVPSHG